MGPGGTSLEVACGVQGPCEESEDLALHSTFGFVDLDKWLN